jgi:hypothetical protein
VVVAKEEDEAGSAAVAQKKDKAGQWPRRKMRSGQNLVLRGVGWGGHAIRVSDRARAQRRVKILICLMCRAEGVQALRSLRAASSHHRSMANW